RSRVVGRPNRRSGGGDEKRPRAAAHPPSIHGVLTDAAEAGAAEEAADFVHGFSCAGGAIPPLINSNAPREPCSVVTPPGVVDRLPGHILRISAVRNPVRHQV